MSNKKNKDGFIFWGFVIALLISIVIYSQFQSTTVLKEWRSSSELQKKGHEAELNLRKENLIFREKHQMLNNQSEVDSNFTLIPDYDATSEVSLVSLLDNEEKLVFNFSDLTCSSCLNSEMKQLRKFINNVGRDKVIILANFLRHEDLILFKRINQIEVPLFNKQGEALGFSLEDSGTIFMFTLDHNLKAENFFIPDENFPELSTEYYSILEKSLS